MDLYRLKQELEAGRTIYDLPLRVSYYARVSTEKDEQLHSLKAQVEYFSGFIRRNPNWVLVGGYVDEGLSGTSVIKRENFLRMLEDARLGRFDFLVTKEISRFSRSTLDSIRYTRELLGCGVGVLFQSDNINTLAPDAELRLAILSSIAQDEVRKISERVTFGFRRAVERGVVLGNGSIWGYRKEDGRLIVKEDEAVLVREIFELYADRGMSIRGVCAHLSQRGLKNSRGGDFSFSTIRGILSNPKYKGYYCGGKSRKLDYREAARARLDPSEWVLYKDEDTVPPIVSEELWDRAGRMLDARGGKGKGSAPCRSLYPYSGKLFCSVHGAPFYRAAYRGAGGLREVWQCREYASGGRAACSVPVVYTEELDRLLREALELAGVRREELARALADLLSEPAVSPVREKERSSLLRERGRLSARKDRLLDLCVRGSLSEEEFRERNEGFNRELESLAARLEALESSVPEEKPLSVETLLSAAAAALELSGGFDRALADTLLDRAEVSAGEGGAVLVTAKLRFLKEPLSFVIRRCRGKASVCSVQYI
ncbi:recombinase family protein [Papillibacter cinnamivorans]|uniref:Site-specific DNA recombinase n=1 Tax=Papillibacter cinnamivorans DSM 12816 TaxID=1122930 RepID=A0A1W1ZNV5_9FIRM|nr:recombinase family protein [Papillibacter cinnamivorans]SMC50076.1 Site-specific DNA recombinase [Papillibacter cinnamivorans DSM 12816]